MIVGLISSYREGSLLRSCIASARTGCDSVCVFEGPIGDELPDSTKADFPLPLEYLPSKITIGRWKSDAVKRTKMLWWARNRWVQQKLEPDEERDPLWILWLDGDEILLWGEYLRDWIERAEKESGAGGFPLRLVELDGSVAKAYGRIVRGDLVERYLVAAYQLELVGGMIIALPNVQICAAGGVPYGYGEDKQITIEDLAELRPPLAGEPHILHRPMLRDPAREAQRQHEAEAEWFKAKA